MINDDCTRLSLKYSSFMQPGTTQWLMIHVQRSYEDTPCLLINFLFYVFFIPKVFCIHINIYFFTVETSYAILPCMYMQPLLQSGLSLIRILIDAGNRQLNSRR